MFQKKTSPSRICRFGCPKAESPHHIFAECDRFTDMRENELVSLYLTVKRRLDDATVEPHHQTLILEMAKSIFSDSDRFWPLSSTVFFLGQNLKLIPYSHTCLSQALSTEPDWSTTYHLICTYPLSVLPQEYPVISRRKWPKDMLLASSSLLAYSLSFYPLLFSYSLSSLFIYSLLSLISSPHLFLLSLPTLLFSISNTYSSFAY